MFTAEVTNSFTREPITSAMPKRDSIVLWPAYFDARRSREEGRRVSKKLAVENPTAQEIAAAARSLGLNPEIEEAKSFPATPWRKEGRVRVKADYYKTSAVKRIAEKLKAARGSRP